MQCIHSSCIIPGTERQAQSRPGQNIADSIAKQFCLLLVAAGNTVRGGDGICHAALLDNGVQITDRAETFNSASFQACPFFHSGNFLPLPQTDTPPIPDRRAHPLPGRRTALSVCHCFL
jgi:hypothetical protein